MNRKPVPPRPEKGLATRHALSSKRARGTPQGRPLRTLAIDVGGTGIKMLVLGADGKPLNERARELTPQPAKPEAVLALIAEMIQRQPTYDRVSVGFPGVVVNGVVLTAPNLGSKFWRGRHFQADLERIARAPVRVINDADLQGYGVIGGQGVELVLTLGTGMGAALFVNGRLVPNLELGHHPFEKGKTYEQRVCDAALKRVGKKEWNKRVAGAIAQLGQIFNYDTLYLGGGNAQHLKLKLPDNVRLFSNVDGMTGGTRLWDDT